MAAGQRRGTTASPLALALGLLAVAQVFGDQNQGAVFLREFTLIRRESLHDDFLSDLLNNHKTEDPIGFLRNTYVAEKDPNIVLTEGNSTDWAEVVTKETTEKYYYELPLPWEEGFHSFPGNSQRHERILETKLQLTTNRRNRVILGLELRYLNTRPA